MAQEQKQSAKQEASKTFPSLIVFDLDDCVWSPETYTLSGGFKGSVKGKVPNVAKQIIIGARFGSDTLTIHPGARTALHELWSGKYDGHCNANSDMRAAIASSADNAHAVKCAHKALSTIDIAPGVTVRQVVNRGWSDEVVGSGGHIQIGRSKPLSGDKSRTHFPLIRKATGVPYSEMLFFDDSNWSDNCGVVERNCKGVVAQRTPNGMQNEEWSKGLAKWQSKRNKQK